MKRPEPMDFYQPASLAEASSLLLEKGPGGHLLAGGTDLVIAIKEKGLKPRYVVDLKRISGLSGIAENPDGAVVIGALTTMRQVETSPIVLRRFPFLAQSAAEVGSIQIRNRATIGGNMANATPSADVAPPLIALDTEARLVGRGGERVVKLEEFFRGPGETALETGEILTALVIPARDSRLVGEYIKFSPREMMDLAYVGVAATLVLHGAERFCNAARVVLGAVSPTPIRAREAEALLVNRPLTEALAEEAGVAAARSCSPISDVRSSAAYRREMVRVHTKRALLNAAAAQGPVPWTSRRDKRY